MPRNFNRSDRVADVMHRALAKLIREDFKDPRAGMTTISTIQVTPDLRHAKILVTVLENDKVNDTLKVLNQATGFFRSCLAKMLTLRSVPTLSFVYDDSVVRGTRINSILEHCIESP